MRLLKTILAVALLAVIPLTMTGCRTGNRGKTPPQGHVSRPTLFEVRRAPTNELVAGVMSIGGSYGQIAFNPAMFPLQEGDMWHDLGMESPPGGDMCAFFMPQIGPECMVGEWEGEPNNVLDPQPCAPPSGE